MNWLERRSSDVTNIKVKVAEIEGIPSNTHAHVSVNMAVYKKGKPRVPKQKVGQEGRSASFTDREIAVLLTEVYAERNIILSKCQTGETIKDKDNVWSHIAQEVSAVGVACRSADQVRIKWRDLKKSVHTQDASSTATGGGPPPKVSKYTDLIYKILGDNSDIRTGIDVDGTDSSVAQFQESELWRPGRAANNTPADHGSALMQVVAAQVHQGIDGSWQPVIIVEEEGTLPPSQNRLRSDFVPHQGSQQSDITVDEDETMQPSQNSGITVDEDETMQSLQNSGVPCRAVDGRAIFKQSQTSNMGGTRARATNQKRTFPAKRTKAAAVFGLEPETEAKKCMQEWVDSEVSLNRVKENYFNRKLIKTDLEILKLKKELGMEDDQ